MIKIIAISDTHGLHRSIEIQKCDILIHSGDANISSKRKAIEFLNWLEGHPANNIIYVAGNHDWTCQNDSCWFREECEARDIIYLQHEACEIEGIKIFGSPFTPQFCNWAFMRERHELAEYWAQIPENTEILITHGPPQGIMDLCPDGSNAGCQALLDRIVDLKNNNLRFHLFGHIHSQAGSKTVGKMQFKNLSVLDEDYELNNLPVTEINFG